MLMSVLKTISAPIALDASEFWRGLITRSMALRAVSCVLIAMAGAGNGGTARESMKENGHGNQTERL